MSKLESFIRRMQAQVVCIDAACEMVADVPGVVFELGLGNGRTYDHLRERLPGREIYVFDMKVYAPPACVPDEEHMILGRIEDTLPKLADRFSNNVALLHTDIGSSDQVANKRLSNFIAAHIAPALCAGAAVVSDREIAADCLTYEAAPESVYPGRYFIYRRAGDRGQTPAPRTGLGSTA